MKSNYHENSMRYTQCVRSVQLRPITQKYEVEDRSVTTDQSRPDPSLDEFPFEHEIIDTALEQSLHDTRFYQNPPQFPK